MDKTAKEKDYLEVDLLQLIKALWKRFWIIVLAVVVCGGGMFWYTSFVVPKEYTAGAMLYVNNSALSLGNMTLSDITASKSLVGTYMVILKSRTVLNEVIEQTGVPYDYASIEKMIAAEPVDETEIFEIQVTSLDPAEAELIANCICRVLPEKIKDVIDGSSVRVVDYAVVPTQKSAPNVTQQTALGMIIGFLISAAGILIAELSDQFIRSEEYLMQTFGDIPVLASIPDLDEYTSKKYNYYGNSKKGV